MNDNSLRRLILCQISSWPSTVDCWIKQGVFVLLLLVPTAALGFSPPSTIYSSSARIELSDPNSFSLERFGLSVANNESKIAVGVPFGGAAGNILVFDRKTGNLLYRLTPIGPAYSDYQFGTDLDIDGNMLIVGSPIAPGYIFDLDTGQELRSLTLPGQSGAPNASSVAIKGNRAVIGDSGDNKEEGAAYIFDVSTGSLMGTLRPNDGSFSARFGSDVAMSDKYAFIGSRGTNYVYQYDLTTNMEVRKFRGDDTLTLDGFGQCIAYDNGRLLVGSGLGRTAYLFDVESGRK